MNRNQWFRLAFGFMAIMIVLISLDVFSPLSCGMMDRPLTTGDVWCVIQAEMYDPFIMIFGMLWILFIILGFLEKKK